MLADEVEYSVHSVHLPGRTRPLLNSPDEALLTAPDDLLFRSKSRSARAAPRCRSPLAIPALQAHSLLSTWGIDWL